MESWSYASEEKRYLFSDEMDFSLDAYMRSRRAMVEWDNNKASSYIFEKDGFISDKEVIKSFEFVDLGFPDLFRRPVHGSQPPLEASNYEQDSDSSKKVNSSTHVIALNSALGEVESESRHSFSLVESKIRDSSLIDLKLGRLGDCKDASSDKNDNEGFAFQPMHPVSALTKRAQTSSSLPTQTRVCQVYGCHKDLSSSKEYHKRHKVCDVHSKTAKAFVNGIEQRFCQQCSRFHLLAEFDDGKRSCRRRLAGHNERRRKSQFDYMSGKPHKILQSCQGTKYFGASLQKRPQFAFHDVFQSGGFYAGKYEHSNHQIGHIKLEDESIYSSQLANGLELSRASNSRSCALSLLSAQSQDLTTRGSAGSLISQRICSQHSDGQVSETPFGISSLDKNVPSQSFSCEINSMEITKSSPIMPSDVVGHALQLEVHGDDDTYKPSNLLNSKYHPPVEHSSTVDLFQLSSHLQRVEQQRNSVQVKHENEDGCLFPTM